MILAEIERRTGHRIAQMFDLIAGTSTGGVLALGLTIPQNAEVERPKYKASQLVSFYEEDGKEVFHSFWQNVTSLHGLIDEKYPSERLEKVLRKYMGEDTRLSQALTEVLITSYEIESCRPFFFTRRKARAKKTSRFNPRMWEVARCTSAAPTYFSPFQIKRARAVEPAAADAHRRRRFREQPHALCLCRGRQHAASPDRRSLERRASRQLQAKRATRRGPLGEWRHAPMSSNTSFSRWEPVS